MPGIVRAREAEARWESRRARMKDDRAQKEEARMRAYAKIRYTGQACAEMHTLYDLAERPQTSPNAVGTILAAVAQGATPEGWPHAVAGGTAAAAAAAVAATAAVAGGKGSGKSISPRSARHRNSGAGRVALLAGARSLQAGIQPEGQPPPQPRASKSPPYGTRGGGGLPRIDSGLRLTASLPALNAS